MINKIKNKKINLCLVLAGIFIMFSSIFVSAGFGIGFPSRINIYPGETVSEENFVIQNVIPPVSDTVIKVVVEEGSEYVSLTGGDTFEVAVDQSVKVPIKVSVSANAKVGDTYQAVILFNPISGSEGEAGGTIQFVFGQRKTIDIAVIEKPVEPEEVPITPKEEIPEGGNTWLWILGIAVVIVVGWILWNKKKK